MSNDLIFSPTTINQLLSVADLMAKGTVTVPKHLQKNPADCLAIIMQAAQWGMNPYAVAQKTHIVSGNLGYEAQLVNAVVSSSNAIEGRFHYQYSDGEWKDSNDPNAWVCVGAVPRGESEICWGEPLYPSKVTTKNSPLWKTAPKQQAAYLAVKYWCRLYCPAVILGVYTVDELQDCEKDITPKRRQSAIASIVKQVAEPIVEPATQVEAEQEYAEIQQDSEDLTLLLNGIKAAQDKNILEVIAAGIEEHLRVYPDDRPQLTAAYKSRLIELKSNAA